MKSKPIKALPTIAELENMMNKPSTSAEDKAMLKIIIDWISERAGKYNILVEFTPDQFKEFKEEIRKK